MGVSVILGRLPADDAVDLLEEMDPERRELLLETLDRPLAARLRNLMLYGGETAGGLMNPDVIFFRADQSVADTLEVVRELAGSRRLFYVYVTDDRGHLIGLVNLWQLLTATRENVLRDIMSSDVVSVQTDTPQEEVAQVFTRYDLLMMPVRDEDGRLVGAITVDDVIDVIEEEASADLYRLGNLPAQEGLGTPLSRSVRLRLPWLLTQLAMALPAALVVSRYQETLVKYVLLAAFFPMIFATGTYAGTQTLTVMVASLAGGEMDLRQVWQVVAKQAVLGLVNGLVSGLALGLVGWLWERNWVLAGVLLVAQIVNMLLAALLGATIPLLLHRLKLDPALGSPIVVSALAHFGGLACFLALASLFLARLV